MNLLLKDLLRVRIREVDRHCGPDRSQYQEDRQHGEQAEHCGRMHFQKWVIRCEQLCATRSQEGRRGWLEPRLRAADSVLVRKNASKQPR